MDVDTSREWSLGKVRSSPGPQAQGSDAALPPGLLVDQDKPQAPSGHAAPARRESGLRSPGQALAWGAQNSQVAWPVHNGGLREACKSLPQSA